MRVTYLATGAGNMYCGSCLHGNTLAAALRKAGHDVLMLPLYTPIRTDEENESVDRMGFGGINVYLQQKWALFRHTPWFLDRLLDRPRLLRWLGKRSASTEAEGLGPLCVSMLQGEKGRQGKELDKLLDWLAGEARPEVVHLSNTLLVGMARQIGRQLGVPVVCTLSGEDIFLEKLPEPHYGEARELLRRRCADLAALVAWNRYYADRMADYLAVDRARIAVIRPGLNLEGHRLPTAPRPAPRGPGDCATIGFFGRICEDKGLHLLAEAFVALCDDREMPPLRLRAGGYLGPGDRSYLDGIEARLRAGGLADRFEYVGELDRPGKIAFLQSLDVMSLPTVYAESKGFSVLEAWANGIPVVLPAHGALPELVDDTGGGLLCRPHDPLDLAAALKQLLADPHRAAEHGRRAQRAVHERYDATHMARAVLEWYGRVIAR